MKLLKSVESLRMSVRSIGANKIRSFLTALGVMIGVGAVIALVALGNGARVSVQQSLESLGSNLLIVYSGQPRGSSLVRRNTSNIVPVLTDDDVAMVAGLGPDLVLRVAPESTSTSQVKFENYNTVATVSGTTDAYPYIRNFHPIYGAFVSPADVDARRTVAVIGAQIYRDLFPAGGDPLGQRIRIDGVSFTIIGVMEEKGSSAQDTSVFIPITTFQRHITGGTKYQSLNIQAANTDAMAGLEFIIGQELLRLHRLPSMEVADFYIANQLDLIGTVEGVAGTFTLLLGSIAAISLLVGGIGIMNIMLVSVTERTREIGVRMALGAKSRDVLAQFLTEAVILSIGGGLLGVAIGIGVSSAAVRFAGMASVVSLDSVFIAFGFAVVIGLFFGGYPAYRASRLNPIDALRYE